MPFSADCATTIANCCNQGTSRYSPFGHLPRETEGKERKGEGKKKDKERQREAKRGKEGEGVRQTSDSQGTLDVEYETHFFICG